MILKVLFIITVPSYLKNDKFQVKNVGYFIAKLKMSDPFFVRFYLNSIFSVLMCIHVIFLFICRSFLSFKF